MSNKSITLWTLCSRGCIAPVFSIPFVLAAFWLLPFSTSKMAPDTILSVFVPALAGWLIGVIVMAVYGIPMGMLLVRFKCFGLGYLIPLFAMPALLLLPSFSDMAVYVAGALSTTISYWYMCKISDSGEQSAANELRR